LLAENRPMGTGVTRTLENVEVNTAYVRLPDSQWTVAVGIPTATTDAAVADALALYGGGIAASILIALLAAALAARGISEPIHQLREAAERIGRGQLPRLPDTAIDELAHLGRSMEASAAELRRLEGERSEAMDQLRNVRDDLRERVADLEQINTLMQQLVQQDALDAQLQTVLGTLCNLNRGDKALITVADARTRQLQVRASCGLSAATVSTLERGIPGNSTCSRALLESRRIVIEDVESDPAFADFLEMARVEGVRSVHSMPIRTASQRLLGVVSVYRAQPGAPDERDLRLAELCAHTAAVVIERTLAEADAMESTRRLRFALDSSTVPFSILTPLRDVTGVVVDFTWFYLNRAAALDAGHPVEALRGQVVSQKAPHLWKISDLFDAYVAVAVRGEARELEVRADHDGSERWMHVVAAPFDDKVAVWSADVTHRVMQERALQAADRRKDDFLAILAHELRNPLAPIQHAATISSLAGATEAQQRWSREVIERQVKQMAMLLDDLLDVSRITRGKLELRKSVIDLRSTIEAAVETARPHIEARQHVLTLALPEERIALEADALRLAQVVTNLLVNAARYTERGGAIRLSAEYSAAGEVRIEVADNGNGIADADVEAIFEMFAQGSNRAAHGGGLGIGLALSRGIVRLHGGELRVHSDGLGLGSRFTVSLPLGAAQVIEAGADVPTLPALGRRLNVLIADDNRDAADTLATLMRLAGHSPRVAYEGASAVERFRAQPADVVLLDIGMPGMSGYEVARRIRSLQRSAQPPLIMAMSGWGQPKDKHAAADAGIDHHLTKPVTTQALMDVISAHFQDARSAA
jgi:signal transduction histidine kinase/CheY-like chemotaxis protein/HAMP domain-containing protein